MRVTRRLVIVVLCAMLLVPSCVATKKRRAKKKRKKPAPQCDARLADTAVLWAAPFLSGGGYCSEATAFAMGLLDRGVDISVYQHGDSFKPKYVDGLDDATRKALERMHVPGDKASLAAVTQMWQAATKRPKRIVAVCHSEPGAWVPSRWAASPCPPPGASLTVGRTMFETDRLPDGWADRLNKMDAVWVPTDFHARIFADAGVARAKIRVVPEPVDTAFFSPASKTLRPLARAVPAAAAAAAAAADHVLLSGDFDVMDPPAIPTTTFLSVFKWEERKAWKVLLRAYFAEFDPSADAVCLLVLTNAYHGAGDFPNEIDAFVKAEGLDKGKETGGALPRVQVLTGIKQADLPSLYAGVDALVQPSRGEGWGRPHVEAMAMGKPVIATDWSGPTAYLNENNGYPLRRLPDLVPVKEGAFKGHLWAEPDEAHLRELLRRVVSKPDEARAKGKRARKDMRARFTLAKVTDIVEEELARLLTDR